MAFAYVWLSRSLISRARAHTKKTPTKTRNHHRTHGPTRGDCERPNTGGMFQQTANQNEARRTKRTNGGSKNLEIWCTCFMSNSSPSASSSLAATSVLCFFPPPPPRPPFPLPPPRPPFPPPRAGATDLPFFIIFFPWLFCQKKEIMLHTLLAVVGVASLFDGVGSTSAAPPRISLMGKVEVSTSFCVHLFTLAT